MSDVQENNAVFSGTNYAENYRKGRPTYPTSLIESIISFLKEKYQGTMQMGVDVGCGPGESTWILQPHFKEVVGVDNSNVMIDDANKNNAFSNVEYKIGSAEKIPCDDSSVTLITAGRAIQYFDFPKFFTECKRVLVPGGVVAFYSSEHIKFVIDDKPEKAKKLNDLFTKLRVEDTKGFWEGQIGIKQRKYVDIEVPFDEVREIRDNSIFMEIKEYSLQDLLNLFLSVPAFLKFAKVKGEETWNNVLEEFIKKFLEILELPEDTSPNSIKLKARHDYFVVMGRKS